MKPGQPVSYGKNLRTNFRVGTRPSPLAVRQTEIVIDALTKFDPQIRFEIVKISTRGDDDNISPLSTMGIGVFIQKLEEALLGHRIDFIVHSFKDIPSQIPTDLEVLSVMKRADPRDVLVNRSGCPLSKIPSGSRIGTSSPRRRALILSARPDVDVLPIRGNVETRLEQILASNNSYYDGTVLAAAGLQRLNQTSAAIDFLDPKKFVPAVAQGALAIELRANDYHLRTLLQQLRDPATDLATSAERAFLQSMGGGCSVPISAHAVIDGKDLYIRGFAADSKGIRVIRKQLSGSVDDGEILGRRLAEIFLNSGAKEIVKGNFCA